MNIEDYVKLLNDPGLNIMELSRETGLSYTLLRELKSGKRTNTTISTLNKIKAGIDKNVVS